MGEKMNSTHNIPVELAENIELEEFHSSNTEKEYLLILNDRHYKISQSTYNLIKTLEQHNSLDVITSEYSKKQGFDYSVNDINHIINTNLASLGIIKTTFATTIPRPKAFLWVKLPFLSENILNFFSVFLQYLFKPIIARTLLFFIVAIHYYIFVNYSNNYRLLDIINEPNTLLLSSLFLFCSGIFHELGHISACRYYGVKYKEIGLGLYLTFPVLYSNITDAWRLEPNKRAVIDAAGLYFQLALNLVLFTLFLISGQYIILIIVIKLVVFQSFIVLNPFFRFDGYWLATDLLNIPNLRKHSAKFITYLIQKYIFKSNPSEFKLSTSQNRKYLFILYSIASNIFIIYFIVFIFLKIPEKIIEFPFFSKIFFESLIDNYYANNWKEIGLAFFQYFMRILILGISLYFIYRVSKAIFIFCKNGYRQLIT